MPVKTHSFPTPPVPLTEHPAQLPRAEISDEVDHVGISTSGLQRLYGLSVDDLTQDSIWRDTCALTGTLRTFYSAHLILRVWQDLAAKHQPSKFSVVEGSSHVTRLGPHGAWVEAMFTFEIQGPRPARCSGIIGLVPQPKHNSCPPEWKIWLLSTILEQPHGFPDVDELQPTRAIPSRACDSELLEHYDVVIAGGSIAGLCMAGRAQALGLSYLVVEKSPNVGDNWLIDRYHSLKLHTSKHYNQMPFTPATFGEEDPYHLGTADLADGFQRFVDTFEIQIRLSTELISGSYDSTTGSWSLKLKKPDGMIVAINTSHCVLAVGNMGVKPNWPILLDRERYQGDVIHGMDWRSGDRWKGQEKHGVCIGSANTAHGVIADMARAGFKSITMIQRSKTFLLPTSTFSALVDPVFNDQTALPLSDRMLLGYPLPVQRLMAMAGIQMCAESNGVYFDRMEAQGWDIERNGDLWGMMYQREGGHFFDLGSAELIANGTVKVICDSLPVSYTENGLKMSDGSHIDADVIVAACGYEGNLRDTARRIFGDEIGDSLDEFWQCDAEGESRGAWKWSGHPRLWYTGHGFAHARYYSRFVALHIKADIEGHPIETYTETPQI